MGKSFHPDAENRSTPLPPSLRDLLPQGHVARFLLDVVSALDLRDPRFQPGKRRPGTLSAYAPEMRLRLLLYGHAQGESDSRKFERHSIEGALPPAP